MENFTRFLETFVNEDAFLLFLIIMVLIILILVVALFKTRQEYLDLLNKDRKLVLEKSKDEDFNLDSLKATSPDDVVKENEQDDGAERPQQAAVVALFLITHIAGEHAVLFPGLGLFGKLVRRRNVGADARLGLFLA